MYLGSFGNTKHVSGSLRDIGHARRESLGG